MEYISGYGMTVSPIERRQQKRALTLEDYYHINVIPMGLYLA